MGTNGTIKIIVLGKTKTIYNHYDSYASELGVHVLDFLRETDMVDLDAQALALKAVNGTGPTPEQVKAYDLDRYHEQVSAGNDWYAYLRGTQGNLRAILNLGIYEDFGTQTEEYNYIIDLDADTFTVTKDGWGDAPETHTWPLDALPTDAQLTQAVDSE